ncbi:hypothetical protein LCGC14_0994550 [marine sediment metagenome]|uniref:Uncharacterized protein n=1 Tax=marine sediment metagenome TaxID=412755 RepID=A0A0F9N9E9_9ZZZZ
MYEWLDKIIEEQARINGPYLTQLIRDVAELDITEDDELVMS